MILEMLWLNCGKIVDFKRNGLQIFTDWILIVTDNNIDHKNGKWTFLLNKQMGDKMQLIVNGISWNRETD